jgi:hypothetical protein
MNVTAVEPKGDKAALLIMDNGARVWTPEIDKAKALMGKPIPADWTRKDGDYGPQAFPPREGKKGAMPPAYRNTKEGQAFEHSQMNRRTALMQAIAWNQPQSADLVLAVSEKFYAWLQSSPAQVPPTASNAAASTAGSVRAPAAGESSAADEADQGGGDAPATPGGRAGVSPPSTCAHANTTDLKPNGGPLPPGKARCLDCNTVIKAVA